MLKEGDVVFGSIAALIAATFALLLFYSARVVPPEASRPPAADEWADGFQVDPTTHPPWFR
jgi:hypothetical protein